MTTHRFLFFLLLFFHLLPSHSFPQSLVEDLAIEVKGNSREFAFTNKETAFLYGETNAENKASWQGFNVFGHEFLDDYEIWAGEKKLERKSVLKTIVYPDYLKRVYANGIVEELRVVDSLPLFSVTITSPNAIHIDVIPFFSDGRTSEDYEIHSNLETAVLARKNHLAKTERENYPVWLAIHGTGFLPQIKSTKGGGQFSRLRLISRTTTKHTVVFAVADRVEEAEARAKHYLRNEETFHSARRSRI